MLLHFFGTVAVWWYNLSYKGIAFQPNGSDKLIPSGYVRRARDKLRRLKQTSSISKLCRIWEFCPENSSCNSKQKAGQVLQWTKICNKG